jgi:hypothetical protein
MGKFEFCDSDGAPDDAGVTIEYDESEGVVRVGAWHDGGYTLWVGSEAEYGIPLAEFLDRLGITDADIRKARRDSTESQSNPLK